MAAPAIIGHSESLLMTLYAAVEEEFPVMDSIDCPEYTHQHERAEFMEGLIDMLIGLSPTPEEFCDIINEMLTMFDNEMLVDRILQGDVTSLILNDNGYYLAELRCTHAA
jgi:hypothetical protein